MFSSIKKKDDEYKQQKITYPILGIILGTTLGYYSPIVFLFTKFLSVTAAGGLGCYTGNRFIISELEDNHYKECAFKRYTEYNEKFQLTDSIFRKYIMENPKYDINYSYRLLYKNILNEQHMLSKCYTDMLNKFRNSDNKEDDSGNFLNYYFYHLCQYLIHLKKVEDKDTLIEMDDLSTFHTIIINNNLLKVFDYDSEIFLKLYITIEKIICDDIHDELLEIIKKDNIDKDKKIKENRLELLNKEKTEICINGIDIMWLKLFKLKSSYEKLSIFYEINIKIALELEKNMGKSPGSDEIMPVIIQSLLQTDYDYIYSDNIYINTVYNKDIYNNIFEFLIIRYNSIIKYIIDNMES